MHGLFSGAPSSGEPWPVDVLTLEQLITGEVYAASQKWGWCYLQAYGGQTPAQALDVQVSAVAATGAVPAATGLVGRRVSFGPATAMIALITRGPAADAVWDQWNGSLPTVAAEVLVGPYRLAGTLLSPDGTVNAPMIAAAVPFRDATISRVDGAGAGAAIQAGRGVLSTAFVQAAAPAA